MKNNYNGGRGMRVEIKGHLVTLVTLGTKEAVEICTQVIENK